MGSPVVLLGDQLPVPSQQGLRGDKAGDLGKSFSSQRFGLYGQSPALMVIEAHSPATELFAKHPVLLAKIFNDLQLAVVHPPGDGDQQEPEWVEHSLCIQNPLSRPPSRSGEISHLHADPVFGPYAIPTATKRLAGIPILKSSPRHDQNRRAASLHLCLTASVHRYSIAGRMANSVKGSQT